MITDAGIGFFIRRTLIVLLLVILALFLWQVAYAFLLAFGGVLFAVFLRGIAGKIGDWTGLGMTWSLALVGVVLVVSLVLGAVLIGPSIVAEMGNLGSTLTKGIEQVRTYLEGQSWGRDLLRSMSDGGAQGRGLLRAVGSVLSSAADALVALVLVLFAGIYFAATPRTYIDGTVRLLPQPHQGRAREVLRVTGNALWLWLLGRFVVMLLVGVVTTVALLLIGVPLAPVLGVIAGLLEFVPFIGPIAASVPIILVALTVDTQTALYAAIAVLVIQQVESNLFEPLVERRAVSLPPVLVLVGAIALTLLFGILGAMLATPLLVVVMVFTKMLYMEDVLEQQVSVPGRQRRQTAISDDGSG